MTEIPTYVYRRVGNGRLYHLVPADGSPYAPAICGYWPSVAWTPWRIEFEKAPTCTKCDVKVGGQPEKDGG